MIDELPIIDLSLPSALINSMSNSACSLLTLSETSVGDFFELCRLKALIFIKNNSISELEKLHPDFYQKLECYVSKETLSSSNLFWSFIKINSDRYYVVANQSYPVYLELQRIAKENDYMSSILDHVPNFLFWKDKYSVFLGCNALFAESAGLSSSKEIVGKTDYDMPWGEREGAAYIADDQKIMNSGVARLNVEETQSNTGSTITLLTSKAPLIDLKGEVQGIIGIYSDITPLKNAQEALKKEKQKAEAANIAKTNFLATMSHELRTPLNGILGTLEILQRKSLNDELAASLNDIQMAGKVLLSLITDILDFSSIEEGRLVIKKECFRLSDLISGPLSDVDYLARKKNLVLTCESTINLSRNFKGDLLRIRQVLVNLLINAIKFTEHDNVTLRIDTADVNGSLGLSFSIEDTGVGIPEELQERIFERFMQVDTSYDRRYGGVGLGLAICKELTTAMGGAYFAS